ncbi:MAG: alpha/beta hydrolase [Planctomycetota bacterium]|nr:alpha/beta hydrolase [Planctomycetota bacterium]
MTERLTPRHAVLFALLAALAALVLVMFLTSLGLKVRKKLLTRTERGVVYGVADGRELLCDIHAPRFGNRKRPVLLWIHGGSWIEGSRANCSLDVMALYGWTVIAIDYRLVDSAPFPAQVEDCRTALRWIVDNADERGFDAGCIAVAGNSAGGHLASLLATSYRVQGIPIRCVAAFFTPFDLTNLVEPSAPEASDPRNPLVRLFDGPLSEKQAELRAASPIYVADSNAPPFLIYHGERDDLVPVSQAKRMHSKLRELSVESKLVLLADNGHGMYHLRHIGEIRKFLEQHCR